MNRGRGLEKLASAGPEKLAWAGLEKLAWAGLEKVARAGHMDLAAYDAFHAVRNIPPRA